MWLLIPILEVAASVMATYLDQLFWVITAITILFTGLIFVGLTYFTVRYMRGRKVDRSNPPQYNSVIEVVWTVVPLVVVIGLFAWSSTLYLAATRVPANALEINVVGKQWMWKLQQPNGRWENNMLHVPVGRPIVLTMTSEDVIHAFYVPAFRTKKDVVPGEYTQLNFTPNRVGTYHLFCAEFCGTEHSKMTGSVEVMMPADYERWLAEGAETASMASEGRRIFIRFGCNGCHGANSSVRAPRLEGIYGKPVAIQVPVPGVPLEKTAAQTIVADQKYIHDSIVLPERHIAAGFKPIMPSFKNRITEVEILKIIAYIRSLGKTNAETGNETPQPVMSEEDYRARTGFVPSNMKELTRRQTLGLVGGGSKK